MSACASVTGGAAVAGREPVTGGSHSLEKQRKEIRINES